MLGPSVALFATGHICQALGWPVVFYIFGESPSVKSQPLEFKTELKTGYNIIT